MERRRHDLRAAGRRRSPQSDATAVTGSHSTFPTRRKPLNAESGWEGSSGESPAAPA